MALIRSTIAKSSLNILLAFRIWILGIGQDYDARDKINEKQEEQFRKSLKDQLNPSGIRISNGLNKALFNGLYLKVTIN